MAISASALRIQNWVLQPFYDYLDTNSFKIKELPCVALFLWLGVTSVTALQALQALHPVTL
jgi:hypothetical protein